MVSCQPRDGSCFEQGTVKMIVEVAANLAIGSKMSGKMAESGFGDGR